jgi:hypothetical protein
MTIPILEEETVFLDYLDEQGDDWGFKLIDDAPQEAIDALASYLSRAAAIRKSQDTN